MKTLIKVDQKLAENEPNNHQNICKVCSKYWTKMDQILIKIGAFKPLGGQ